LEKVRLGEAQRQSKRRRPEERIILLLLSKKKKKIPKTDDAPIGKASGLSQIFPRSTREHRCLPKGLFRSGKHCMQMEEDAVGRGAAGR